MDRAEINQHVIDTLGKILVDKTLIQEKEDAMLSELVLDEDDFEEFFTELQSDFKIVLPTTVKSDISHLLEKPDYRQLTLQGLVDVILTQMKSAN